MNTGQIISGAGHFGLIAWALFGNVLASDPIPFEVTEVTAITEEEFAAVMATQRPPNTAAEIAAPETPDVPQEAPELSSQVDAAPDQPAPDAAQSADPDATPELTQTAPPTPAEVTDEPPVLEPPQEDMAALLPETTLRPKPRPVERVAPEQVAPPEPDTAVDDVQRDEVRPDEAAETPAEESEATAPEEAATEIVTEAEQAAPSKSVRPKARPTRAPEPPSEPIQTAETPDEPTGVEAALAAALGGATEAPAETTEPKPAPAASGPPLNAGEKDALRVAVQQCWNVGSLSSEALNTTVIVAVQMTEDAKPVAGSIRMISASGGSSGAAKQAYEAARRAIIRCGSRGFNLPAEKYGAWRDIEMTFNPEKMRIK
ncbi:energy transducer TonB [Roseovarius pelagicus]|uniref:Energy transducer TonB n=1 Tax=Roseovarius pelagicus TaxID=2980108 RepID=A0ABY6DEZ0_9RHOB|nr:energy transducer TonB [Roseovarius pelagicus]UXX84716.1 energy transducer TonB [Roseovarius pelagicus]